MSTNPIDFPDFRGRSHAEPSIASLWRVVEARRAGTGNPFPLIMLGGFNAGGLDEIHNFLTYADFAAEHDPEGAKDTPAKAAAFAFQPGVGPEPAGCPALNTVRVGTGASAPTRASLTLVDVAVANVLTLTSIDAGTHVNRLRAKVEAGTGGVGRKLLVGYKDTPAWVRAGDKLGPLFTLAYTGVLGAPGTATATVTAAVAGTATRLHTALATAQAGTANLDIDLTAAEFATVGKLIEYINRQAGYRATPIATDLDLSTCPSSALDAVAAADIVAGATIEAKLGAIVHWVNQTLATVGPIKGVTAARVAGATTAPAAMDGYSPFLGGTQPAIVAADYEAALAALLRDGMTRGVLMLDTDTEAIVNAVLDWRDEQEQAGRRFRVVFGMASTTSDAAAVERMAKIDSPRVSGWYQQVIDLRDSAVTHDPLMVAAMVAGMTAGARPLIDVQTVVLSDVRIRASAIAKTHRKTESVRTAALFAGVNTLREDNGVRISLAIGADHGELRAWRMWSEALVIDAIEEEINDALRSLRAAWATPQYLGLVRTAVLSVLRAYADTRNPVITSGTDPETGDVRPAYDPPAITIANGQTTVETAVSLAGETDHIRVRGVVRKVNLSA